MVGGADPPRGEFDCLGRRNLTIALVTVTRACDIVASFPLLFMCFLILQVISHMFQSSSAVDNGHSLVGAPPAPPPPTRERLCGPLLPELGDLSPSSKWYYSIWYCSWLYCIVLYCIISYHISASSPAAGAMSVLGTLGTVRGRRAA